MIIAKLKGKKWCVYDTDRASYPRQVPGFGVVEEDFATESLAQPEVDRLAGWYQGRDSR